MPPAAITSHPSPLAGKVECVPVTPIAQSNPLISAGWRQPASSHRDAAPCPPETPAPKTGLQRRRAAASQGWKPRPPHIAIALIQSLAPPRLDQSDRNQRIIRQVDTRPMIQAAARRAPSAGRRRPASSHRDAAPCPTGDARAKNRITAPSGRSQSRLKAASAPHRNRVDQRLAPPRPDQSDRNRRLIDKLISAPMTQATAQRAPSAGRRQPASSPRDAKTRDVPDRTTARSGPAGIMPRRSPHRT